MGSSQSRPPPPPEPESRLLQRTITDQAQEAITSQLIRVREERAQAQENAAHYKQSFEEALGYLDSVAEQHEQEKKLALAAIAGAAAVAGAVGGAVGVLIARRANVATVARVSQEMVEMKQRGAASLARAERFGAERLAKSLVPALDAMDALEQAAQTGGGDAEGARLTRASLHDALRSNGIEAVAPDIGAKFDVASALPATLHHPQPCSHHTNEHAIC